LINPVTNTKITLALFLLKSCHFFHISTPYQNSVLIKKPSCSWWYGSWIYNYLFNQCLSPLTLWVWTSFMVRCTWYNIANTNGRSLYHGTACRYECRTHSVSSIPNVNHFISVTKHTCISHMSYSWTYLSIFILRICLFRVWYNINSR
jgi:hypothetical protein